MPPKKRFDHTVPPTIVSKEDAEFVRQLRLDMSNKFNSRVNLSDALRECLCALDRADGYGNDGKLKPIASRVMRQVADSDRLPPFQCTQAQRLMIEAISLKQDWTVAQVIRAAIDAKRKEVQTTVSQ